ncbi:MAG: TolB family protein [Terriglobales bacterium]|jgi:TolB protein
MRKGLLCISSLLPMLVGLAYPQSKPALAYQLTYSVNDDPFPSPDGKQLVYDSVVEGKYQLFVMDVDGKNQRQITHDPANHETPSWSPDGSKIAFVSDRNGHSVVYIMNVDGSGEERLTDENAESIHPTWSADSKSVLYCADDDLHPPKKNDASVYSIDIHTKQLKTLITGGTNTYPSWSPDGTKIVFRKMLGEMNSEVFLKDGNKEVNLSSHPSFDGWPAWSPDGKRIAFASNRNSNYQIFVMNSDGSNVQLVANTEGRATEPRWTIDGKQIIFPICKKLDFGRDCQIYVAPAPLAPVPQQ